MCSVRDDTCKVKLRNRSTSTGIDQRGLKELVCEGRENADFYTETGEPFVATKRGMLRNAAKMKRRGHVIWRNVRRATEMVSAVIVMEAVRGRRPCRAFALNAAAAGCAMCAKEAGRCEVT